MKNSPGAPGIPLVVEEIEPGVRRRAKLPAVRWRRFAGDHRGANDEPRGDE